MAATSPLDTASRSDAWRSFRPGIWQREINVRDFSPETVEQACRLFRAQGLKAA